MDAASTRYLENVAEIITKALDGNLTGIYLHGSAVLGGYDARHSDLDVLVVVPNPITEAQREAMVENLTEEALPCPAAGLEMSIVTEAVAAHPRAAAPAFELHMTTGASDTKVIDGHGHGGDPDLVLHFAVCRASAKTIASPKTTANPCKRSNVTVFGVVPRKLIKAQLRDELRWAVGGAASRHYTVLNASRAWTFLAQGQLVSKIAGAEWALRQIQSDDGAEKKLDRQEEMVALVKAALARQSGSGDLVELEATDVEEYVGYILEQFKQDGTL